MVSRTSPARKLGIDLMAERRDFLPLLFGIRLGDARRFEIRCTVISCPNSVSQGRAAPEIGAALLASGVQASGMCPSPASSPEVGSSPTQPAPGR
jgi:hypothetical protein